MLRVPVTDRVRQGEVFAPMHWSGETAPTGRIDALVAAACDPVSGQPESKAAMVAVAPWRAACFGYAVSRSRPAPECGYWARARSEAGWRLELAGAEMPEDWEAAARQIFGLDRARLSRVSDPARGIERLAFHENGRLKAALFVAPEPVAVAREHFAGLLGQSGGQPLSGRPGNDTPDPGSALCACLGVGMNAILTAIESGRAMSVEAIGASLGAGTSCGGCRPELATRQPRAAE